MNIIFDALYDAVLIAFGMFGLLTVIVSISILFWVLVDFFKRSLEAISNRKDGE